MFPISKIAVFYGFMLMADWLRFYFPPEKSTVKTADYRFKTIVIDPGHGGKDPGAHGNFSFEKNVALSIGKKLQKALKAELPDIKVIMTRSGDQFIELNQRSEIANKNHANLFVSIHCNSSPEESLLPKQNGAMVLVYGYHRKGEQMEAIRENASIYKEKNYKQKYTDYGSDASTNMIIWNAYMQKYRKQSILFGDLLLHEFKKTDHRHIIGLKEQGVLVLAHSAMPSVLIETGFINNPIEEKYLNSAGGQQEIVQSIIRSLKRYIEKRS
ncbi:MAG: N-acetylmuramoyl-L-alanine amidase [Sphingobacteriaceae bacterium]|nr:MAG: N-acetylmuramoyl-L-alanine amidase [Sphingobacteriaceae bacterium]